MKKQSLRGVGGSTGLRPVVSGVTPEIGEGE
jgi:hypothetical protein